MRDNWTDAENDTIVADYFAMLAGEEAGQPYSKAEHNRMVAQLTGRPRGSIEYKHQNISAVLKGLGETWIQGYKPAYNFQGSLVLRLQVMSVTAQSKILHSGSFLSLEHIFSSPLGNKNRL